MLNFAERLREVIELAKLVNPDNESVKCLEGLIDNNVVDSTFRATGHMFEFESDDEAFIDKRDVGDLYDRGMPMQPEHTYGLRTCLSVEFYCQLDVLDLNFDRKTKTLVCDGFTLGDEASLRDVIDSSLLGYDWNSRIRREGIINPGYCFQEGDEHLEVVVTASSYEFDDYFGALEAAVNRVREERNS